MKVKHLNLGVEIDGGAPTPTILSTEFDIYLIFFVQKIDPNWDGSTVTMRSNDDEGIVTVKLSGFAQFKFGKPNDETAQGHPYYKFGLRPYAIQEVLDSDWIEELRKMNSVHPYHEDARFQDYRHLVFFFHDLL